MGMVRLSVPDPGRGLFGYRSEFLTDTRGTGTMHHRFLDYGPWAGPLAGRKRGVLVADREGAVVAFALGNLQERAQMFVAPGEQVYEGMIVGENSRPGRHGRQRDQGKEAHQHADDGHRTRTSSWSRRARSRWSTRLEYIEEDELIEVTPEDHPAAQAGAGGGRPEEGGPGGGPDGGRVVDAARITFSQ